MQQHAGDPEHVRAFGRSIGAHSLFYQSRYSSANAICNQQEQVVHASCTLCSSNLHAAVPDDGHDVVASVSYLHACILQQLQHSLQLAKDQQYIASTRKVCRKRPTTYFCHTGVAGL
jgi:hypothetical protein